MSRPSDMGAAMRYLAAQRAANRQREDDRRAAGKCAGCGLADAPAGTRCADCRTERNIKRAVRKAGT